jgi:hypothetical protein
VRKYNQSIYTGFAADICEELAHFRYVGSGLLVIVDNWKSGYAPDLGNDCSQAVTESQAKANFHRADSAASLGSQKQGTQVFQ